MKRQIPPIAVALLLVFAGCAAPETETADTAAEPQAQEQLPAGHPPVGTQSPVDALPAPPPGSGSGVTGLTWSPPAEWLAEPPANAMRKAQYTVPGPAGPGECVVYYFGPGQGGGPEANALRWAGQFGQPDGTDPAEALTTEEITVGDIPVLLASITGTYSGGMAMMGGVAQQLEDYMLLGAIASGADANWFFKFTGPRETVEAEREAFLEMIRSLAAGG